MKKTYMRVMVTLAALVIIGSSFATVAYLTGQSSAENAFGIGTVGGEVTENFTETTAAPDEIVTKEASVANTGTVDAYVRIKILQSSSTVKVDYLDENENFLFDTDDLTAGTAEIEGWTYESDGFFYYGAILPAGETTEPMFSYVKITEGEAGTDFDIYVSTELVQASGMDGVTGAQEAFAVINAAPGN